jgi:hypothetical protein
VRQKGELLNKKVELLSIEEAIKKGGCKRNCIQDLDARIILNIWYFGWGNKYEDRAI